MPKVYTDHIPPLKVPQQYATFGKTVNPRDFVKVAAALLAPHEDEKSRRATFDKYRESLDALEERLTGTEKWDKFRESLDALEETLTETEKWLEEWEEERK